MDLGYAIQILREKVADDSYELTLAVEQKDEEIQERQKERLAILQDAMNALAKLSSVPQANELLPHVIKSVCGNSCHDTETPKPDKGKCLECGEPY